MPFLAPIIPALIGAGGAIGSTVLGSKLSGGGGGVPNTNALLDEQRQSIKQGRDIAGGLTPQANNLLGMATSSYSPVAAYYSSLLSPNRNAALNSLSPDVQRINEGYNNILQSRSALTPRSGASSSFYANLPFQRMRDVNNLLATSRPAAAEGLLRTGSTAGATGSSLYSTILNALSGSSSTTSNLLGYDLASRNAQYARGKDIGSSIFDLLKLIPGLGGGSKVGKGGLLSTGALNSGVGPGY